METINEERSGLSRRALIKRAAAAGAVAWTAPVIVGSVSSPAGAAVSPIPCVPQFTSVSNQWVVDNVTYPVSCPSSSYNYHRDLQLTFTVHTCEEDVKVWVKPLDNSDGPDFIDKARWCWSGVDATIHEEVLHTFPANQPTTVWLTPHGPPNASTEGGCTHDNYEDVDDGIHVSLCWTNQVRYKYQIGAGSVVTKYVTVLPNGTITET